MKWTSICLDCGKVLESCPNGIFAEAAARIHKKQYPEHRCYVGTEVFIEPSESKAYSRR